MTRIVAVEGVALAIAQGVPLAALADHASPG